MNGTLYSLLSHSQIAQRAKSLELEKVLEESQKSTSDKDTRKQINFILEQIHKSSPSSSSNEDSVDDASTISDEEDDESIVSLCSG